MADCRSTRYGTLSDSTGLLKFMRKEFLEVVDQIAEDSVTDQNLFDQVKTKLSKCAKSNRASHPLPLRRNDHVFVASEKLIEAADPSVNRKPKAIDHTEVKEAASAIKSLRQTVWGSDAKDLAKESHPKPNILTEPTRKSKRPRDTLCQHMCQAGDMCRMLDAHVFVKGKGLNGSACCKCEQYISLSITNRQV